MDSSSTSLLHSMGEASVPPKRKFNDETGLGEQLAECQDPLRGSGVIDAGTKAAETNVESRNPKRARLAKRRVPYALEQHKCSIECWGTSSLRKPTSTYDIKKHECSSECLGPEAKFRAPRPIKYHECIADCLQVPWRDPPPTDDVYAGRMLHMILDGMGAKVTDDFTSKSRADSSNFLRILVDDLASSVDVVVDWDLALTLASIRSSRFDKAKYARAIVQLPQDSESPLEATLTDGADVVVDAV